MKLLNHGRVLAGTVVACLLIASSCKKDSVESLTPVKTTDLLGIWQLVSASTIIKGTANGSPVNINQKRNGTQDEYLQFLVDGGVAADPSDIFGTDTYAWRIFINNGNDLTLRRGSTGSNDFGYFTIKISGDKMTWTMNKDQAVKSSKDSGGYSSVLNGGADDFDELKELSLVLDFKKK